jgi:hypothetical protein
MAKNNVLDNSIVRLELDEKSGDVTSLKLGDEEFVDADANCAINSYRYLKADDAPEKAFVTTDAEISIKENGPLLATLSVKTKAEGCNSLVSEISIYEGQANVDLKNVVDKIATIEKEGVEFKAGQLLSVEGSQLVSSTVFKPGKMVNQHF